MFRNRLLAFVVLVSMVMTLMPLGQPAAAVSTTVVISQVYGGGGNANAQFTNDFVELFNRGGASIDLSSWSVQYTSASGTGNFGSNTNLITPLAGSLAPGHYLLIQEAAGATPAAPLPAPDVTDSTPINMSATGGKVALVNTTTPLGCNGGSTPCSAAALATIVDLIGYDGANFFEGAAPAPTLSNGTAAFRAGSGCVDTDNNGADFTAAAPAPRTSASPPGNCNDQAPAVSTTTPSAGASGVSLDASVFVAFSEPVNVSGMWSTITCSLSGPHSTAASGGPMSFSLDPAANFVNG